MGFDDFGLKDQRRADGSLPPLFGGANEHWELNAITDHGLELHALGFVFAARVLAEAAGTEAAPLDAIVWPIVFCYRQYVELRLKEALRYAIGLGDVDEEKGLEALRDHNLSRLWRLILISIRTNDSEHAWKNDLNLIGKRIEEFHQRDPRSTEFRYPWLIDGSPKPNKVSAEKKSTDMYYVNLFQLRQAMDVLQQRLDALVDWFDRVWQCKCEMREYYAPE